jgi:hypothetical protein
MIRAAEDSLGYKLPKAYLRLIRARNGGTPRRCCFRTQGPTSWAADHIQVVGIRGIGGRWGIDSEDLGSQYMIQEWGYPDVGIVVGETPSAGHDTVMLDYSECGPEGEPRVIHVETECDEPQILVLAPDFDTFVRGLVDCAEFDGGRRSQSR